MKVTVLSCRTLMMTLALVAIVGASRADASAPERYTAATLAGTWMLSTEIGPEAALPSFVTYAADGTLVYADALMFGGVELLPMKAGPFFGVWERTGPRDFGGTSVGLLFDPTTNEVVAIARARSALHVAPGGAHASGTIFLEMAPCPTPVSCPDPADPDVSWIPFGDPVNGFTVSLSRIVRVPATPLE
jgi:hypothetical protein